MTKPTNDELFKNTWSLLSEKEIEAVHEFCAGYIDFLSNVKTEREAVIYAKDLALKSGFKTFDSIKKMKPGDKVFLSKKEKYCALMVLGEQPLEKGVNFVVAHIDAPRIDLKGNPLYEADAMALLKTHYYGGIKKYQWVGIPLALHGVVVKANGETININIGEDQRECCFTITDLLPHLGKDQMEKKMGEGIKGEDLNILIGSIPEHNIDKRPIKNKILNILKEKYNIDEEDFVSAEIEAVPAFPAREIGLDRSMVGAYGQDDRVSAYTALQAILEIKKPKRTAICLLVDKEEIGSAGNTGLQSILIENMMAELMNLQGVNDYYSLRIALENSYAISADVNAAIDPNYPEVFEKMNNSFLSHGVVLTKFTGSRGKTDSNDSNPEFLAKIRGIFNKDAVSWQIGELGKVDIGGGGTVAQYLARYGMEVVDCGVALLGMHSPFEIASKADVYMAYKAYKSFFGIKD